MNHFDKADFSECHSEEVISFFWRSVYIIDQSVNILTLRIVISVTQFHHGVVYQIEPGNNSIKFSFT